MAHSLYAVFKNIFPTSDSWPNSDQITWDQFSLQYVGIIIFVICFLIETTKKHLSQMRDFLIPNLLNKCICSQITQKT